MSDPVAPNPGPTPTGYQRSAGGGFKWVPPSAEHLSKLLPQYDIECLLGHGGMGAVYKGRQRSLNRPVAIKILPQGLEDEDASYTERFKNEAQILARLSHPCIVAVHDFGETSEGQLYIVMEFVNGTDVAQMITSQGRLPPEHALAVAAHVCDALSYAHKNGVIHRDIKPANILINHEGAVKVADFGLAKVDESGTSGLTKTGMAMGTPDYVAPEALIMGTQIDGRADLYAIGVMLYHMLTGEVPRGAFDLPSRRFGTDPRFDAIILKAMKMDREERYQSSGEIRRDLDVILSVPLVQAGGTSSAAIPQHRSADAPIRQQSSPRPRTEAQTADEGVRAPFDPSSPHSPHPKSKATMITLAATAAVLATGAFLVLKPGVARNSDSETAPQPQNSVSENRATPTAKQSGPLSPLSGPANDAKTPAQGVPSGASQVRTTLPAAPPAKPILVAQANTTPKALQLGQSAPSAGPVSARKLDPAKWVKLDPKVDCLPFTGLREVSPSVWEVVQSHVKTKAQFSDIAVGATVSSDKGWPSLRVRISEKGFYQMEVKPGYVFILRVTTTEQKPVFEIIKQFKLGPEKLKEAGSRLVLSVINDQIAVLLEGQQLGFINDSTFQKGSFGFSAVDVATFRDIEYQTFDDAVSSPVVQAPATPSASTALALATLPPELTTLQQQYDKLLAERVSGIYDADVAKLNTGYLAGLDRAATTAQSAGELDTVLAIQKEKELIAAKQPVPATDDAKTPEALKNLRTIYRTSLAQLDEQRTANHTALLTPYATRLKQIEADLTKAGRIPDAVAVKQYREGLGTNLSPVTPTPTPTSPTTPPAATANISKAKGDDRAAAEWVLTMGGQVRVKGSDKDITARADLPSYKFSLSLIEMPSPMPPVADTDFDKLANLEELKVFRASTGNQTDEAFRFLSTCLNLTVIELQNWPKLEGRWLAYLAPLKNLWGLWVVSAARSDTSGLLQFSGESLHNLNLRGIPVEDNLLARISGFKDLKTLNLRLTKVTDQGISALATLTKLELLELSETAVTAEGLLPLAKLPLTELGFGRTAGDFALSASELGTLFPKLERIVLPPGKLSAANLAALGTAWPKLKILTAASFTQFDEDTFNSIGEVLPALERLELWKTKITDSQITGFARLKKLTNLDLAETNVTDSTLPALQTMRSLKSLALDKTSVTDAAIAAFKKARPDVRVTK